MEALDWASQKSYDLLGHSVVIRSTSERFADRVNGLMRSFPSGTPDEVSADAVLSFVVTAPSSTSNARPFHFVYKGCTPVARTLDYWHLFRVLEIQMLGFVGENVHDFLLLHAGAVAKGDTGIIMPGGSGSGKSTLSLGLTTYGFNYSSDEVAAIDPENCKLEQFPKAIGIKNTNVFSNRVRNSDCWVGPDRYDYPDQEQVWYVHVSDLGGQTTGKSVSIRYVIFPRYVPDRKLHIKQIPKTDAARLLMANTANFQQLRTRPLGSVARIVREAECFELSAGSNLEETVRWIEDLVSG